MRKNNVLGIIFSNTHDEYLPELTQYRALGSVPFGGRYRLIDFQLSNLVNAGISKVGIITKTHYHSLMDHLGSGKAWDLSRKTEGLYFLPPATANDELYSGRISSILGARSFFRSAKEDYVILSDCNVVGNIDYDKFVDEHVESKADITIAYKKGLAPPVEGNLVLSVDETDKVTDIRVGECAGEDCNFGIGLFILSRDLLRRLIDTCISRNQTNFEKDILQSNVNHLNIRGYEIHERILPIYSTISYFKANIALLNKTVRDEIFNPQNPIYTKVRDAAPAKYGLKAKVTNTLVADGSFIEGEVKNSIIFRDVRVGKNVKIENSIIMQGCVICDNASLTGVILDKDVVIKSHRTLAGAETFPIFVNKGRII